jgi:hypothetical protein
VSERERERVSEIDWERVSEIDWERVRKREGGMRHKIMRERRINQ